MRRSRAMLLALAVGLAGMACTGAPTTREVCEVLCGCEFPLPAQRDACTDRCAEIAPPSLDEACATCITDVNECRDAEDAAAQCREACPELDKPDPMSGLVGAPN